MLLWEAKKTAPDSNRETEDKLKGLIGEVRFEVNFKGQTGYFWRKERGLDVFPSQRNMCRKARDC